MLETGLTCADQDVHSIHANGPNPDYLVSENNLKSQILHVKDFAFRYAAVNVDKMLLAGGFLIAASNNADKVHFPPHIPIRLSITSSLSTSCCSFL